MNLNIIEEVVKHLVSQHQWNADRLLDCLVYKHYDTAVGPKKASLWVRKDREFPRYWMQGCYESEGRNVVESCFCFIAESADLAEIATKVDEYLSQVERAIGQSYAVKLLRN